MQANDQPNDSRRFSRIYDFEKQVETVPARFQCVNRVAVARTAHPDSHEHSNIMHIQLSQAIEAVMSAGIHLTKAINICVQTVGPKTVTARLLIDPLFNHLNLGIEISFASAVS